MKLLFGFWLIVALFCFCSCQSPRVFWLSSSGIVTYNRHTGQFELLWENETRQQQLKHDTVYLYRDRDNN